MTSELRSELHSEYINALLRQSNTSWTAYLLGEDEDIKGNIHYIKCSGRTKEEKLLEIFPKLEQLIEEPKYIIRLDDDDIISLDILSKIEKLEGQYDVFVDRHQAMFDMYSGKCLEKEFPWWPSTIIMEYKDALTLQNEFAQKPLYACSHDLAFHKYYKERTTYFSKVGEPIYTRIFSPTSITFNQFKSNSDIKKYKRYIAQYGFWKYEQNVNVENLRDQFQALAIKYFKKHYRTRFLYLVNSINSINYYAVKYYKRVFNKLGVR
jgi:hypothetical protein